jgi:hypothetical protein
MYHKESKTKEILISKAMTSIMIIYLLLNSDGLKFILAGGTGLREIEELNFLIILKGLIHLGVFIFRIFLIKRLTNPKESKYTFINFNRGFHPFFVDKNHESHLKSGLYVFIYWNLSFGIPFILKYFNYFKFEIITPVYYLYNIFIHISIFSVISIRNSVLNSFPVEFLKSNRVRMIVKYEDYINHKIVDDEPHLTINQYFDVNLKSLPRNSSEKNVTQIKNPNTPINPVLVYKIEDKDLADAIREGYILKVKLVEIKEEGNLEIELSLRDKRIESD